MTVENQKYTPIWRVTEPSTRADAPEWMSFHLYKEAQRCPLAVSLQRSEYQHLWNGLGYPVRPTAAAISGIVVHEAIEAIVKEFAQAGISSLMELDAMRVMKELGGFTKVLERAVDAFFASQTSNPRFEQFRDELYRSVRAKLPQLRATLQALLAGNTWMLSSKKPKLSSQAHTGHSLGKDHKRFPLGVGTFVEVDLQDVDAKWKGRIDVLTASDHGCTITDLKSGTASEEHKEQLSIYRMLWVEDSERNPSRLPVKELQIIYASGPVAVPVLSAEEGQRFRTDLIAASTEIRAALNSSEVPANPSRENCRHCSVKLLCQPFWQTLPAVGSDGYLSCNEVTLLEARGDRAWLASVVASPSLPTNERVVIRNYDGGKIFWDEMKPGTSIRLTDGVLSSSEDRDIPVVNLSMMSEGLFVSQSGDQSPNSLTSFEATNAGTVASPEANAE